MAQQLASLDMVNMSITNKCILRCPSCPTGRYNQRLKESGRALKLEYMPLSLCERIFAKVHALFGSQLFYLHIWNEPLLNPDIILILQAMEQYGHTAYISSNCNVRIDFGRLLSCRALKTLVISMSGMRNEIYERGHRGGKIDIVLQNLIEISKYTAKSSTRVVINYHEYTDNVEDREALKNFCKDKGIEVLPYPAVALQENIADYVAHDDFEAWQNNADINERVIPRISMRPFPFTRIGGLQDIPCRSQTNILVLDHEGNVCTCTHREPAVVERVGNFLAMSPEELAVAKLNAASCRTCRSLGLHMEYVFACFFFKPCTSEQLLVDFLKRTSPAPGYEYIYIYIYGAGMMGAAVAPVLRLQGYDVRGFIDDDPRKIGHELYGVPIFSWQQAQADLNGAWVIDTVRALPARSRLEQAGLKPARVSSAEDFIATIMN